MNQDKNNIIEKIAHTINRIDQVKISYGLVYFILTISMIQDHLHNPFYKDYYKQNKSFFIFQNFTLMKILHQFFSQMFNELLILVLIINLFTPLTILVKYLTKKKQQQSIEQTSSLNIIILFFLSFPAIIIYLELIEFNSSILVCQKNLLNHQIVVDPFSGTDFCDSNYYKIIRVIAFISLLINAVVLIFVVNFLQPRVFSKMKFFNKSILLENITIVKKALMIINNVTVTDSSNSTIFVLILIFEILSIILLLYTVNFYDIKVKRVFTYIQFLSMIYHINFFISTKKYEDEEQQIQYLYICYILIPTFLFALFTVIWQIHDNDLNFQFAQNRNLNDIFNKISHLQTLKNQDCILIKHKLICRDIYCCYKKEDITLKEILTQILIKNLNIDPNDRNMKLLMLVYLSQNNFCQFIQINEKFKQRILSFMQKCQLRAIEVKLHQKFHLHHQNPNHLKLVDYFYQIDLQNQVQTLIQQILQDYKRLIDKILTNYVNTHSFYNYAKNINQNINYFRKNLASHDSSIEVLQALFIFTLYFCNEEKIAQKIFQKIKKKEIVRQNKQFDDFIYDFDTLKDSFFIQNDLTFEKEGLITNLGGNIQKVFETSKNKLIGKQIGDILPICIRDDHLNSMLNYTYQKIDNVQEKHQDMVLSDVHNIVFFSDVYMKYDQDIMNNKIQLKSLFNKLQHQCIIINEYGLVSNLSEDFKIMFNNHQDLYIKEGLFIFTLIPQMMDFLMADSRVFRKIFDKDTLPPKIKQKLKNQNVQLRIKFSEIRTKDLKKYNKQTTLERDSVDYKEFSKFYSQYLIENIQNYTGFSLDIKFDIVTIEFPKQNSRYYVLKIKNFQQTKRFSESQFNQQKNMLTSQLMTISRNNIQESKENMLHAQQLLRKQTVQRPSEKLDIVSQVIIQEENQRKHSYFDFKQQFIAYNKSKLTSNHHQKIGKYQYMTITLYLLVLLCIFTMCQEVSNSVQNETKILQAIRENNAIIIHYNNFFYSYNYLTVVIRLCVNTYRDVITKYYLTNLNGVQTSVYESVPQSNHVSKKSLSMGQSINTYLNYIMSLKGQIMRIQFSTKNAYMSSIRDCQYYLTIIDSITSKNTVSNFLSFFGKFDYAQFYKDDRERFFQTWIIVFSILGCFILIRICLKYSVLNELEKIVFSVIQICQKKQKTDEFFQNHDQIFFFLNNIFFGIQYKTTSADLQSTFISQSTNNSLFLNEQKTTVKKINYYKYKVFENLLFVIPFIGLFIFQYYFLGYDQNDPVKYFENQKGEYLQILSFIDINENLIDYVFDNTQDSLRIEMEDDIENYSSLSKKYFEGSLFQDLQEKLSELNTYNICQQQYQDSLADEINTYCKEQNLSQSSSFFLNFAKSELILSYQNMVIEAFTYVKKLETTYQDASEEIQNKVDYYIFEVLLMMRMIILFQTQIELPYQIKQFEIFFKNLKKSRYIFFIGNVVISFVIFIFINFIDRNVRKRKISFWWFIRKNRSYYQNILQRSK